MIDWRPIEGHDLKNEEEILLSFSNGEWDKGWYLYLPPVVAVKQFIDDSGHEYKFDGDGYYTTTDGADDESRDRVYITRYAHITGPDAPNPIREVWEKWKDAINVNHPMTRYDAANAMYDLWRAIKAALGIETDHD